jgi:hypothetical protein
VYFRKPDVGSLNPWKRDLTNRYSDIQNIRSKRVTPLVCRSEWKLVSATGDGNYVTTHLLCTRVGVVAISFRRFRGLLADGVDVGYGWLDG